MLAAGTAPRWATAWAVLLVVVQAWHALVVALLPATLPGGSAAWLGVPFQGYTARFAPYADGGNGFLLATTLLDVLEIALVTVGLVLVRRGNPRGSVLAAVGLFLYAYKVVVVVAIEVASGFPALPGVPAAEVLAWYLLPQLGMAAVSVAAGVAFVRHAPGRLP
jgi:hypothetical protein